MKRAHSGLVVVFGALAVLLILGISGSMTLFGPRPGLSDKGAWTVSMHSGATGLGMMGQGGMGSGMMQSSTPPAPGASGEAIFQGQCSHCHTLQAGSSGDVGPGLHGLFGRGAGTAMGFTYSAAMQNSGVVWNDRTLDQFLEAPQRFVPGTTMPFTGIADKGARERLIAYLKSKTR